MTSKLTKLSNYDYLKHTVVLKFDTAEKPKFTEKKGTDRYVEFGERNNYPDYLIGLYNESPKHGAIVKGKANYIFGKGFDNVPKSANKFGQSWNSIAKKAIHDDEIFGGYYLQIVYNALGKVSDVYHLEFKKVRASKDESKFFVKNDWSDNKEKVRVYDAFNPNAEVKTTQILFVKQYSPDSDVYPLPNYFQGLNYIESDIQVSRHILGNAKQGFVGSTLINLNNGEPQEEQKGEVERGLKKKFTGAEGDRIVLMFNKSKETAADIVPLGQTMLTKEDFTNINNLIQQEIFACHQVTSPMLFGIKTEGQLGGRSEIQDAYEIFNNTYVNERQQAHEEVFNKLMQLSGITGTFKIKPVEPLGFALKDELLLQVLPREYFLDKLSVDEKYYNLDPVSGPAHPPMDASGVPVQNTSNSILTNLTGRQHQNVMRIVRKFNKGEYTKEQASMMLKDGFGFTDENVNTFLGIEEEFSEELSMEDEALLQEFANSGESIDGYEVISKKPAREAEYFAEQKKLNELESNVLNLISKDERITPDVLAKTLEVDQAVIEKALKTLTEQGVIKEQIDKGVKVNKIVKPLSTVKKESPTVAQILIRYQYTGPLDDRNRPFCKRMMELSETGRIYSRSDIEAISERLGYSVWDRRGGWFTTPDGDHRPYCRHSWNALTVLKKK